MQSGWDAEKAAEIIRTHRNREGPALPILHAIAEEFGYIPREAVLMIAEALNITRAEMHGIVTYYHDFHPTPPGRHVLKLCRAEACQSMGGEALATVLLERLGLSWGKTTADGALTVEPVFCLGLCACSPSALYDGAPLGRLNSAQLEGLVARARAA